MITLLFQQMFNMENTALYSEIRFSQALKHFKQEMLNLMCPSIAGNISKRNIKSSTLEVTRLISFFFFFFFDRTVLQLSYDILNFIRETLL